MYCASAMTLRECARALIVDAEQRVLLFRGDLRDRDPWWFAPGGALELGETYEAALAREVLEETALAIDVAAVGPAVWTRDYAFMWQGRPERQRERFFLIRVVSHDVDTRRFEGTESDAFRTFRWWAIGDIQCSNERFSPGDLGAQLNALFQQGLPAQPVSLRE
jgi:8-oxo-dGTP pyrophosphatase MutT (NUDIX family)